VIEIPSLPEFGDDCIPLRPLDPKRREIELCPEQELQKHSFAICGYLTDEVHPAVDRWCRVHVIVFIAVCAIAPDDFSSTRVEAVQETLRSPMYRQP
jgi:hypothetical protein